jgi:hypothetical protein
VRLWLGEDLARDTAFVSLIHRSSDQAVVSYKSKGPQPEELLVSMVRGVPGVYVFSQRQQAHRAQAVGISAAKPRLLYLGNAVHAASARERPRAWEVKGLRALAVLPAGEQSMALMLPFSDSSVTNVTRNGADSRAGAFIIHPAGVNRVSFVGVSSIERAGGYRLRRAATAFRLSRAGAYLILRRSGRLWRASPPLVVDSHERVPRTQYAHAVIPLDLADPGQGFDESAARAFYFCRPLSLIGPDAAKPRKNRRGRAMAPDDNCWQFARARR